MKTTEQALLEQARDALQDVIDGCEEPHKTKAALKDIEACIAKPEASQDEIIAFLKGSAPLEGVYFGENHPTKKGLYWWRKLLPCSLAKPDCNLDGLAKLGWQAVECSICGSHAMAYPKPVQEPISEDELDVLINGRP